MIIITLCLLIFFTLPLFAFTSTKIEWWEQHEIDKRKIKNEKNI